MKNSINKTKFFVKKALKINKRPNYRNKIGS